MKTKKRLLSILLTLALVLGLIPGMSLTAYADGETETATLPTSPGNYILTADVTVNSAWHPVNGITLNLGGHRISQTGTNNSDGSVIVIDSGTTFTMTGTGTLTDGIGSNEGTYYVGGGVMVLGTFNMYGGTITGNSASGGNGNEGGGVWVGNGGTFNMYDGAITNNTGSGGGVGIGVNGWNNSRTPGTFNMYGGSISGNSSSYAAGVRLNNGTFNMQGGTITGGGSNFDIRVDKDGASRNVFNLSGNVTIGSIRFDGEMKANIAGRITNTSAITVYMDKARVFTNSSTIANNEAGRFVSGLNGYVVLKNNDGQLYLGNEANYAISFESNGGSGSMTTEYVVAGGKYSLPDCRFTPPANKDFKAWEYDGTEYNAGYSFTNVSKAMTFTAIWEGEEATVTKPPTAKNLTYTGSAQELVTAGTATGGEMQYALGTATEATEPYTTSIPAKTEAGTYYVWYKAVADDTTHSDSDAAYVTVTIAAVQYSTVSVTNAEHTIGNGKDAVLTVKGEPDDNTYENFTGADMDGNAISDSNYTKAKGSLILTLKSSYLDTLTTGDHKVTINFKDGAATAILKVNAAAPTPTPKPLPKTGDSGNPLLWLLIALLGVSLLGITVKKYAKK